MSDPPTIVLKNPSRAIIPAIISGLMLIMFLPPLVMLGFDSTEPGRSVLGCVAVLFASGFFAFSAARAPVEANIGSELVIRRWVRESHFSLTQITKWFFAVPSGPPTQLAPSTNAMLNIQLDDRTHFRAEVTTQEAAELVKVLSQCVHQQMPIDRG